MRRIIPPAMPIPAGTVAAYHPPKYRQPEKSYAGRIALVSILIVVGAGVALLLLKSRGTSLPDPLVAQAPEQPRAELAAATQAADQDALHEGWVGVFELADKQATLTIATLSPDAAIARKFAGDVSEPVALAALSIDNSAGKTEVLVNVTGATLQFTDGSSRQAPDVMQVLQSVKNDRDAAQRALAQPYRCRAGEKTLGKLLLLPSGTDPHTLASIRLHVNGRPAQVAGSFKDQAAKAKMAESGALRVGGS
ncbi:MAG: hypothetical protein ABIP55_12435 [Tepidisphaeraceae bacterium]